MPNAPAIISGPDGTHWLNDTGETWEQIHVTGFNTCGYCWSLDGRVARSWPLPFHGHCRCWVTPIRPGRRAPQPFASPAARILTLEPHEQDALMGPGLSRLWRRGAIALSDAIGPDGVRSLEWVARKARLSIRAMVAAGIAEAVARRAYHAAKHEVPDPAAGRLRRLFDETLPGPAKDRRDLIAHLSAAMPRPGTVGTIARLIPAPVGPPPDAARHAAELRALLMLPPGRRDEQLTDADRRLVEAEVGPDAARSVGAFVAAVARGTAAGRAYGETVTGLYERLRRR